MTTIAPTKGDVNPEPGTLNPSDATFGVVNTKTDVNINLTITGLRDSKLPDSITFNGTMQCESQGNTPVTLTVAKDSNTVALTPAMQLLQGDVCKLTVTRPDSPPRGYTWGNWVNGPELVQHISTETVTYDLELTVIESAVPPHVDFAGIPLPFTGGVGTDVYYISASVLAMLIIAAVALYRRKLAA